ncbi:GNAT family N-acetyltransferase [Auraticoccus monumenti]|uniref:Protein N-acetyltransferase, RimJ/RimL family n=1 Tax=Auraticoccus monumenti TaxID=675864 RepID=A0A1G6VY67_9ACTN|nr:GNAT family protein [Auraticoccus monumenti]SDD57735.1 Protein N-acetyltransferase, RimJ/RimL family [Auraticoccus monumenti]
MELLRPWGLDDAGDLVRARASHPDLARQLAPIEDQVVARSWVRDRQRDPYGVFLAIEVDGHAVGQVAVSHLDPRHGTGWLSYWVAADHRRRGLAGRCAATVADWALDVLGLHRLELGHRVDNTASARVAEVAGFVAEGVEREKFHHDGARHDVRTMARLVSDPRPSHVPVELRLPTTGPGAVRLGPGGIVGA